MTVRELQKKLREFNPDAVVIIGEKKDGLFRGLYEIGQFAYLAPEPDPWRAKYVAILRKEVEEDDSQRTT